MTPDATTTTNTSSAMTTTSVANVPPFTILSSLLGCDPTRSTGLLFNPLIAERSPGADGSDPVRDRTLVRERPSADATHAVQATELDCLFAREALVFRQLGDQARHVFPRCRTVLLDDQALGVQVA